MLTEDAIPLLQRPSQQLLQQHSQRRLQKHSQRRSQQHSQRRSQQPRQSATAVALLALCALLFIGCATAPPSMPPPPERNWQQQRAELQALSEWTLEGKLSVRWADGAENARFVWRQGERAAPDTGPRSELTLQGPLGAGAVRIQLDADSLRITEGGQTTEYADNSPAGLARATGWPIPAQALRWWLRALPAPAADGAVVQRLDAEGWPQLLEQDGWRVHYQQWTEAGGMRLPQRLLLEHAQQSLTVRLILSRWQLPASPQAETG